MKIFISHAVVDTGLTNHFVDLLRLGAGVFHGDIFFSSMAGAIPNGTFFVERILTHLDSSNLIVAMISKSYFKSQFCLQELGAAQARNVVSQARLFSILVPPVGFGDLTAMMMGVQSGQILVEQTLNELRDIVAATMPRSPSTTEWNTRLAEFLTRSCLAIHQSL